MKPIIILLPKAMSDEDIKLLRENDLCVVVADNPALVKFVDPIPVASSRTQIENAAIKLSRALLNRQWGHITTSPQIGHAEFSRLYIDILLKGTPLSAGATEEEQEKQIFDSAKADEIRRLAREEAKSEREAQKRNMKGSAAK